MSSPATEASSWQASLALAFAAEGGHTELVRQSHQGPLVVQRPFYPEGREVCHVYILHPPGGLVPGDALVIEVEVQAGARVLVTSPAATKIYRSDGRISRQTQTLRVAPGAMLEWLPQETIVFEGAQAQVKTAVELSGDAAFLGWEILCLGRPACGEGFRSGTCRQHWELWRDGRPLVLERTRFRDDVQRAAWGLRGAAVTGTLLASSPALDDVGGGILDDLRALPSDTRDLCAATLVRGALVLRYVGGSAERARKVFEKAWCLLRPLLANRPACLPRVWST